MGMDDQACVMDVAMCERHSGAQPGGGICATCLQEKLILLWRGVGNSNWDTEEFSVTPPLVHDACMTPPACEPSAVVDARHVYSAASACFPVLFRVRHLQRDDVHESSKSSKGLEREKIDRSSSGLAADGAGDRQHQFSCELKSIMKELSALHEKKRLEKAVKKRPGTDSGCLSARRQQHEEVAADVTQGAVSASPGLEAPNVAPADRHVAKAKASIVEDEEGDEEARYTKSLCFSALWPAILNMKWARVLVSPIMSSNKIAPSKSDLLSKIVNGLPKAAVEESREESGRNCETSGSLRANNNDFERPQITGPHIMPIPAAALLPPRYVQPAADEDGTVLEIDKDTKLRMEASRITVMTWLQSLPSPKAAVHLTEHNHKGVVDDLSLGNGVLEMCDEEEVEFDCQSQETDMNHAKFESADGATPLEPAEVYSHMNSFGKFLRTSSQIYAPTRMVDIEITAQ